MDKWEADRIENDLIQQDTLKAERLQELARQGKVFICYGPVSKEKLRELELAKLKRWNAAATT